MSRLSIRLFGPIEVGSPNQPRQDFHTDKERALLAYLVIEANTQHSREILGNFFWPDRPEWMARQSLRQALYHIRRVLVDPTETCSFMLGASDTVQFNPLSNYWLDIAEFGVHLAAFWDHHPAGEELCAPCVVILRQAVDLYRGELMGGLSLPDTPQFDIWLLIRREGYRLQVIEALALLGRYYLLQCNYPQAVHFALKTIELEPWQEAAHRLMMRAFALQGQRCEALHQFEICRKVLRTELEVDPSIQTARLDDLIRTNQPISIDDN